MSLSKEAEVARLLRETNERDALFKSLTAARSTDDLRTSLNAIQGQTHTQPAVNLAKQVQTPALRAAEIAKQLQVPALRAVDVVKQLQASPIRTADIAKQFQDSPVARVPEMAKRMSSTAAHLPFASSRSQTKSAETPLRTISDLGPVIRKARKGMKLNQADFAAHAGVGRRFISELEGGKGSLEFDKVIACAIAAGIDISARSRQP